MYAAADNVHASAFKTAGQAVAKSIKHAMAMSTILATEISTLDVMRYWPRLRFYWTIPGLEIRGVSE